MQRGRVVGLTQAGTGKPQAQTLIGDMAQEQGKFPCVSKTEWLTQDGGLSCVPEICPYLCSETGA